jgi:hypothetical protein
VLSFSACLFKLIIACNDQLKGGFVGSLVLEILVWAFAKVQVHYIVSIVAYKRQGASSNNQVMPF